MPKRTCLRVAVQAVVLSLGIGLSDARVLTFEERVKAQEAIERVYYSHQIGATRPFEAAVPRELLERKVRDYLRKQSWLERFWGTPITAEVLALEVNRIARETRFPDRLREIYRALGNDSLLIQECFAKPSLADRLARRFFPHDQRIHGTTRAAAQTLQRRALHRGLLPEGVSPEEIAWEVSVPLGTVPAGTVRAAVVPPASPEVRRLAAESSPSETVPSGSAPTAAVPGGTMTVGTVTAGAVSAGAVPEGTMTVGTVTATTLSEVDPLDPHVRRSVQEFVRQAAVPPTESGAGTDRAESVPINATPEAMRHRLEKRDPAARPQVLEVAGRPGESEVWHQTQESGTLQQLQDPGTPQPSLDPDPRSLSKATTWLRERSGDLPQRKRSRAIEPRARSRAFDLQDGIRKIEPWRRSEAPESVGRAEEISGGTLSAEEFERVRADCSGEAGGVETLREDEAGFAFCSLVEEGEDRMTVTTYYVPKISWDAWWASRLAEGDAFEGRTDALPIEPLPQPSPSNDCPPESWDARGLTEVPTERAGHGAVWTGNVVAVWGGRGADGHTATGSGELYDPVLDDWTPMSMQGAPVARTEFSMVWTGSEVVVWGGSDEDDENELNDGGRYDPVSDTWRTVSQNGAPTPRRLHSAVWTGSEMIIWGGFAWPAGFAAGGGRYDPVLDEWNPMSTSAAPSPRVRNGTVWTGREMVVWGGSGSTLLGGGGRYDPRLDAWRPMTVIGAPAAQSGASAVWTGEEMIVWGGFDASGLTSSGGRYDPEADSWRSTSAVGAPEPRYGHTAIWSGSRMIVWGGEMGAGTLATGGAYDPVSDTWTPTPLVNAPEARFDHTAVWTGSLMVVLGGDRAECDTQTLKTGARYDPIRRLWTPTAASFFPTRRAAHTAVWSGNEMIVWGGATDDSTGARYDPLLQRWTPTSTVGAPSPRYVHTAVWTGQEMIVYGGFNWPDDPWLLGRGGRYDPISDTWVEVPPLGGFDIRYEHTAVWTGREMIVWGGRARSFTWGSGGRYDPATGFWRPTPATSGRHAHAAVWTGTEMLVWGGEVCFGPQCYSTEGKRYDPVQDRWTPLSVQGVPEGRRALAAVWTGNRMIVWGGLRLYPTTVENTGGIYDPTTDSWVATPLENAPQPRSSPSSVWTGQHWVIWGGARGDPFDPSVFGTGGIYEPRTNTWRTTTMAHAPEARVAHSGLWTDKVMLVWGGRQSSWLPLSSGAAYRLDLDVDGDGYNICEGDCDDLDPAVHPGAEERCNGLDDNCDGVFDETGDALCDDDEGCTTDTCGGASGCVHVALPDGASCDDANACTVGDACLSGRCRPGRIVVPKVDCDDRNLCTHDYCDPDHGCMHIPRRCRDGNLCTIDSCDPARGCIFVPQPGCPILGVEEFRLPDPWP